MAGALKMIDPEHGLREGRTTSTGDERSRATADLWARAQDAGLPRDRAHEQRQLVLATLASLDTIMPKSDCIRCSQSSWRTVPSAGACWVRRSGWGL